MFPTYGNGNQVNEEITYFPILSEFSIEVIEANFVNADLSGCTIVPDFENCEAVPWIIVEVSQLLFWATAEIFQNSVENKEAGRDDGMDLVHTDPIPMSI